MPVAPPRSKTHLISGDPKPELLGGKDLPHLELIIDYHFLDLGLQHEGFLLLCPDIIGLRCGVKDEPFKLIPLIQEVIPQGSDVVQIAALYGFQLLHLLGRHMKVFGEPTRGMAFPAPHAPLHGPLSPCKGIGEDEKGYGKQYEKLGLHFFSCNLYHPQRTV